LNTVSSVRVAAALRTLLLAAACAAATAAGAAPAAAASASGDVETRAVVRSTFEQAGGRLYIQLKLVPRSKLPFTTITYRVLDRGLVAKVRAGDSVAFRAQRMKGENVLTALRPAPPCERFRRCE
jgi:Cu/Ag efflux protein CusF